MIGLVLQDRPTSESFTILRQMGDGTVKAGAPRFGMGVIDVRDLSRAHLAAAYLPEARGGHIIRGQETNLLDMALAPQKKYGLGHRPGRRLSVIIPS